MTAVRPIRLAPEAAGSPATRSAVALDGSSALRAGNALAAFLVARSGRLAGWVGMGR